MVTGKIGPRSDGERKEKMRAPPCRVKWALWKDFFLRRWEFAGHSHGYRLERRLRASGDVTQNLKGAPGLIGGFGLPGRKDRA